MMHSPVHKDNRSRSMPRSVNGTNEGRRMTMSFPARSRRFCRLNDLTMSTASSSTSAREICSCHDEVVQPAKRRRLPSAAGPVAPKPSRDTEAQDLRGGTRWTPLGTRQ
ncbi:hypothetical protein VPH35_121069 [Triticum aestivum]